MDFKQICWLASYPKSGNTWLRLLLDAYFLGDVDINDICIASGDVNAMYYKIDNQPANRYPLDVQQLLRPMALTKMVLKHLNLDIDRPLFLKTHTVNGVIDSVKMIPNELTRATIYLVRDPRDIVKSLASHMGYTYDQAIEMMDNSFYRLLSSETVDRQMTTILTDWGQHVKSYVLSTDKNALLVKYEDMKQAPEQALSAILKHCGMLVDEDNVKKAVKLTRLSRLKSQESEQGFAEKSQSNNKFFGEDHKPLTVKQRRKVENLFGKEMKLLGYL